MESNHWQVSWFWLAVIFVATTIICILADKVRRIQ